MIMTRFSLRLNFDAVRLSREKQDGKHLMPGTAEQPQPIDATCPSNNPHGIECLCVDRSVSRRFLIPQGATLLVLPAMLLHQWVNEFYKFVDVASTELVLRVAHSEKSPVKSFSEDDLVRFLEKDKSSSQRSRLICLTTPMCYDSRVDQKRKFSVARLDKAGKKTGRYDTKWREISWGVMIIDEAHRYIGPSGQIPLLFSQHSDAVKWFITGTPYESGPGQLKAWSTGLLRGEWPMQPRIKRIMARSTWKDIPEEKRKVDLEIVSPKSLAEMQKEFTQGVKDPNAVGEEFLRNLRAKLMRIPWTYWIQRNTATYILERPWMTLKGHARYTIRTHEPTGFSALLDREVYAALEALLNSMQQDQQARINAGHQNKKINLKITSFLAQIRRARIYSTFPTMLRKDLKPEFQKLNLTLEELDDKKWLVPDRPHLYKLAPVGSPYEKHIRALTARDDCPKMAVLSDLVRKWGKEKGVLWLFCPVTALITYWVNEYSLHLANRSLN